MFLKTVKYYCYSLDIHEIREILLRYYWNPRSIAENRDITELIDIPENLRYSRDMRKPWNITVESYWDIPENREMLLKTVRYYWDSWDIPENREILLKILLKIVRCSWKPWDVAENREILLREKLLRYYWKPWDIPENRDKTVRYYWVIEIFLKTVRCSWKREILREILLRFVRYYWNPWDITEILLKTVRSIAENLEIFLKTVRCSREILLKLLRYSWKPWDIPENREMIH